MSKTRDIQDVGIVFGDWKLIPLDGENWELCHRHVTKATAKAKRNGTAGMARWHRLGRYYQYGNIDSALAYAADAEVKADARDAAMDIREALAEYESIASFFRESVRGMVE